MKKFDIRDHLDNLEPNEREKGKYICPVCGGNDLAISAKTGAYSCFSSGCEPREIRNLIAPLAKGQRPPKTAQRRNADATRKANEVESKVTNLIMLIALGETTLEQAQVELSAWCQEYGHDRFAAGQLLRSKNSVNKNDSVNDARQGVDKLKSTQGNGLRAVSTKSTDSIGDIEGDALITDHEWNRFRQAMTSPGSFDPFLWLPERLAQIARSDAARNCLDPMALWAYLLPSVLSLMGRDTLLDMGNWQTPNIAWSLLIGESGTGKSRAKSLVLGPLEKWNIRAFEDWQLRVEDWQQQEKAKGKDKSDDLKADPKPKCRRYLVSQSTPEGIVRRLADQEDNGILGYRDEFAGFIKGLTQYTSGKGDGMEMLLETWDGGSILVDRADEDKSFAVESSRLSLVGGIQPGVFSRTFETAEDAQGTLARFLCVVPAEIPYKRYRGATVLPAELGKLYKFIDTTRWGTIVPTDDADDLFTEIAEDFNNQKSPTRNAQPWVRKLAGQTLRLAMAIHAVECFYCHGKAVEVLTADTLSRAYHMAKHYQRHMYHLMGASAADGIDGVLAKIQNAACCNGEGVSARDISRGPAARLVSRLARDEGMKPAAFCTRAFRELASHGWGEIRETLSPNGKTTLKYHAFADHCPKSVDIVDSDAQVHVHQGLRADDAAPTVVAVAVDTALKDTRNQSFQDFQPIQESVDTVSSGVESAEDIAPPIPVGAVVVLSYPRRENPASFQGYGCQGMIIAIHRTRDNWSCSVDVDGETITAWIGDLEELIDG